MLKKINLKSFKIKSLLREVIFVPSTTPVFTLLQKMKKNRLKYPAQEFHGRYGHKHQLLKVDPPQGDEG